MLAHQACGTRVDMAVVDVVVVVIVTDGRGRLAAMEILQDILMILVIATRTTAANVDWQAAFLVPCGSKRHGYIFLVE